MGTAQRGEEEEEEGERERERGGRETEEQRALTSKAIPKRAFKRERTRAKRSAFVSESNNSSKGRGKTHRSCTTEEDDGRSVCRGGVGTLSQGEICSRSSLASSLQLPFPYLGPIIAPIDLHPLQNSSFLSLRSSK